MPTLEIRLFGVLSLQHDGQSDVRLPSRRVRDLMSYLLVTRHTRHSREHLAGLFWGEHEEHKARHCLNTALWRLNGVLGPAPVGTPPYLQIDAHHLGFNVLSDVRLDVAEFENGCRLAEQIGEYAPEQRAALYREAVRHYRADLLVDCAEDWCLVERERLRRLYYRALSNLIRWHMEQGEFDAAIEYGTSMLAQDSLREEIHRDVISCLLAAGRPVAALEQYRRCEAVLERELGIAPMDETQALLPLILQQMRGASGRDDASGARGSTITASEDGQVTAAVARIRESLVAFDLARMQLQDALDAFSAMTGEPRWGLPDSPSDLLTVV